MIVLSFMAGAIFGFVIMGAIVMASENKDRKRAERYRTTLKRVRAIVSTNLHHQLEKLEDVVPVIDDALADKDLGS